MGRFDLEKVKGSIAKKYNWGAPSDWTNFHFKELSREIHEATGDRISEETLKRIFGKRKVDSEKYQPQAFSQMVLVKFIESFEKHKPYKIRLTKTGRSIIILSVSIFGLSIIFLNFFKKPDEYSFSCENQEDYFPFTAIFHYDVSKIKDSVFVHFMNNDEAFLPPDRSRINFFYTQGGKYKVYIYTRNKILDSLYVKVNSRDWQGGFFPNNIPGLFQPFLNQELYRQGAYFYASPDKLHDEGVDLKEKYYTAYKYFSPFGKSLDSLTLETRVLNNITTGSYLCYDIGLSLIGDAGGIIDFKFTQPKCSRYATLRVSEKYLDGEYSDLSALSVDMSDWLQIKMQTENGGINLYLAHELIFTEKYLKELGELEGVVIYFYGSGKIDYLELKDGSSNTFYQYDFSL